MSKIIKQSIFTLLILSLGLFLVKGANAATLTSASDTLSTSRPSAAAPVVTGFGVGVAEAAVTDLPNGAYDSAEWLASDSATFWRYNGAGNDWLKIETLNVASMSANLNNLQRTVFFTAGAASAHLSGETLITPITAVHTIKFTTVSSGVLASGKIVIQFPGSSSSIASPSATGFSFNGEAAVPTDIKCWDITANAICGTTTTYASNQSNSYTLTVTNAVPAAHQIVIGIGCTTVDSTGCTAGSPRLINPIKGTTNAGTADQWKITIKTQDSSGIDMDSVKIVAGTVESVMVQGLVEPYLTFKIQTGGANGTTICGDTLNMGPGLDSTAGFVNLGQIGNTLNYNAQILSVDQNGVGYTITATSSGTLKNPTTGYFFPDANGPGGLTAAGDATWGTNPHPAAITIGATVTAFGIHPCTNGGSYVPTIPTGWGSGGAGSNKFANPWNSGGAGTAAGWNAVLSSFTGPSASSYTAVEYAAAASLTFPAGIYTTTITYVATPVF